MKRVCLVILAMVLAAGWMFLASAEVLAARTGPASTWSPTGSMNEPRVFYTATRLLNGQVLAVGGDWQFTHSLASCELYDPATGTWSATGYLHFARQNHTATLLPDGRVLIIGGIRRDEDGTALVLRSCELYDPETGKWSHTGNLIWGRHSHTATLLSNGQVLVTGGGDSPTATYTYHNQCLIGGGTSSLKSCEIYDPQTGEWSATGEMGIDRYDHIATLLDNGNVLVMSGFSMGPPTNACELYHPQTGTWTLTGYMHSGHIIRTAPLLPDGRVMAIGHYLDNPISCEIYDPEQETWILAADTITFGESMATILKDNRILISSGEVRNGCYGLSCELYDIETGTWSITGNLSMDRRWHTATLLENGSVLVAGGLSFQNGITSSCEVYTPSEKVQEAISPWIGYKFNCRIFRIGRLWYVTN